jgi:hypothetical protein
VERTRGKLLCSIALPLHAFCWLETLLVLVHLPMAL